MLGKMKVPDTVQMDKETNQNKKGPLPWANFMGNDAGFSYQRENKTDKEKNQIITSAGKQDDTDSTFTETTAAFTSVCKLEWDKCTTEGLCNRNNNIEQSDLCIWKKTMGASREHPHPKLAGKKTVLTDAQHSRPWLGTNN